MAEHIIRSPFSSFASIFFRKISASTRRRRICNERGHNVTVLTGMPNYPSGVFVDGYGGWKVRRETWNDATVIRVPIIARGLPFTAALAINYLSFAISASILATVCSETPSRRHPGVPALAGNDGATGNRHEADHRSTVSFYGCRIFGPRASQRRAPSRSRLIMGSVTLAREGSSIAIPPISPCSRVSS